MLLAFRNMTRFCLLKRRREEWRRITNSWKLFDAAYQKQLEVNIDRASIDTILDKYLCYYPKQFHFLLKERIETVLLEQQKKLFEK